jgi:hypothetical protein
VPEVRGVFGRNRELARALGRMETEPSPTEQLPVPAGLFGVLSARMVALPAEVQDVLLTASCLPTTSVLEQVNGPLAWSTLQRSLTRLATLTRAPALPPTAS